MKAVRMSAYLCLHERMKAVRMSAYLRLHEEVTEDEGPEEAGCPGDEGPASVPPLGVVLHRSPERPQLDVHTAEHVS